MRAIRNFSSRNAFARLMSKLFTKFTNAVAAGAVSPFAFIAYVALAAAWALIVRCSAFRTHDSS